MAPTTWLTSARLPRPRRSTRPSGLRLARASNLATGDVFLGIAGYASSGLHQFAGLYRPGHYTLTPHGAVLIHERPDAPGFSFAAEAAAIMDMFGRLMDSGMNFRRLVIIGHSMGAISGLELLDLIQGHPVLWPAVIRGRFIAVSSPLASSHVRMPLALHQAWRWPRPVINDLAQWLYMRGTGYRCERYAMQAAAVACYRQNALSNEARRGQLRALRALPPHWPRQYPDVPLVYLQAQRDPLVAPAAAAAYCRAFNADAGPDHIWQVPGWHGETVGQPGRWLPAIRRAALS